MTRTRLLTIAGVCGAVVIALLFVQIAFPSAPLLPVALVVGAVGALIARALWWSDRD
ncbi:hypothetical protein ACFQ9V_02500 [Leifsonia sp. NPDC056665]|uniref:hypothetical protein n=1 Tax=Leifsonia sp. NPDC056665 TaxID=3345901 RepID=UPI0036AB5AE8